MKSINWAPISAAIPASALLEVLDPEQNFTFSDHYLELAYDLSRVMFITTANTLGSIPSALLDRMEVLEFPGYIEEEKMEISSRFLIPRQMEESGLKRWRSGFSESALRQNDPRVYLRSRCAQPGTGNWQDLPESCPFEIEGKTFPTQITTSDVENFLVLRNSFRLKLKER